MWHHFFPLLFPKDSESLKILDIQIREGGAKRPLNGTSKVNRRTDRHTDGRTFRLIESIGPEGRCFENKFICRIPLEWHACNLFAPVVIKYRYNLVLKLNLPKWRYKKHPMFVFSKTPSIRGLWLPHWNSMKVMYTPLLSSNMSAVAQKLNESLKKQTRFPISFLQSKTTFWAGSQVYVEMLSPWGKGRG